jgi:hypothetical protein
MSLIFTNSALYDFLNFEFLLTKKTNKVIDCLSKIKDKKHYLEGLLGSNVERRNSQNIERSIIMDKVAR